MSVYEEDTGRTGDGFGIALRRLAATRGTPFRARRGELLQAPRARRSPLYVFAEGAAHAYVDAEGGRQTVRLAYPGEMLAALPGLLLGAPSAIGIECVRAAAGYRLGVVELRAFIGGDPARQAAYARMLEELTCGLMLRELDLLEPSPELRYRRVLARSPQVFAHVPLKYVASYLRMAPETLSRIRARDAAGEALS